MNKKKIVLLIIFLICIPTMAFAKGGEDGGIPFGWVFFMEAFVTIHMSLFVLKPIAEAVSPNNSKAVFWSLFAIRIVILLFCNLFVTTAIAIIDFILVFVGAFIIVPVVQSIAKRTQNIKYGTGVNQIQPNQINANTNGFSFAGSNASIQGNGGTIVSPSNFDKVYSLKEDQMLEEIIKREMAKAGLDPKTRLVPSDTVKKKMILNIIFAVLVFVSISSIFIHFPIYIYLLELVVLSTFFIVTRRYSLIKYLKKQLKARPGEKISNIVMNAKNTLVPDRSFIALLLALIPAIALPLIIFATPKIIYEKTEGGYAVRYYIYGLTNFTTAEIPETYNNEKVVSLRGNTFSNMFLLEKVTLPDTVTEIRGQAFKNCYNLKEVNIPNNLQYLGGGSFNNATSIKRIELPDTLTELGGEAFQGASSLEYVRLSNNLTEIRGNTFEDCESLKEITIPDNVTRVGGHAFYGNTSLERVNVSENSKLEEIGSSAFRECTKLKEITLPESTTVNSKAFKASPTTVRRYGDYSNKTNNTNTNLNTKTNTNTNTNANTNIYNLNELEKYKTIDLYELYNQYLHNNNYVDADVTFDD